VLEAVVRALRHGRHEDALALLDTGLASPQPPETEGRARGMRAQALLSLGRLQDAKLEVRHAMRIARALGDQAGLDQLRALNGQIYGALAAEAEQARLRAESAAQDTQSLDTLLAAATTDDERAHAWVLKARTATELSWVRDALTTVDALDCGVKPRVILRLELAERDATGRADWLEQARALADAAGEFQLLAAVAQTARRLGVQLAPPRFA
jgi:hypothetical protein